MTSTKSSSSGSRRFSARRWVMAALGALLLCENAAEAREQRQVVTQEQDESPYLLVASALNIHRMYPNDTELEMLLRDSGITAVTCHYRLGYIFWSNDIHRCIKRANLNGSDVMTIASGDIENPADLTVDWIHDKLYWSDPTLSKIEELDILTLERRIVVQLDSASSPLGLAVYPLEHNGLLYWMDNGNSSLQRILTTGSSHTIVHRDLTCIWPLALDYSRSMIYWTNYCSHTIESLSINGTNHEYVVQSDSDLVLFSYGMSQFEDVIYWTQPTKIYMKTGSHVTQIYHGSSSQIIRDVEVVHPRSQPTVEELQQLQLESAVNRACSAVCRNGGSCILPGICVCPDGWGGLDCLEDVNECQTNNGGCAQDCVNTDGGFKCSCREGYTLDHDLTNCIETPITPSPSLDIPLPTIINYRTNVHPDSPLNDGVLVIQSSATLTPLPPTLISASSTLISAAPSTSDTLSEISHTYTFNPSTASTTAPSSSDHLPQTTVTYTHPTVTTTQYLTSSSSVDRNRINTAVIKESTSMTALNTEESIVVLQTPQLTTDAGMVDVGVPPTIRGIEKLDEEGANRLAIIIPVSVLAGLILLSVCVFLLIVVYVRCRNRRHGSYSFANPAPLDIAGEVSSNALKRGQVTHTSFRQLSTSSNIAETIAILSEHQNLSPSSNSVLSGSDSFEWNSH